MMATVSENQMVCGHCEEMVHRYAIRCPYCNHDLKVAQASSQGELQIPIEPSISKVMQIPASPYAKPESAQKAAPEKILPVIPEEAPSEASANMLKVLLPLISLLAGSFFFFFGMLLKLFSKDGKLVFTWSADSWPYYLFPAIIFLAVGLMTLSSAETDSA